jgi:phage terminase large subunit GpA-like protein
MRQNKSRIVLRRSICHGAWPRGKSRLADKAIRVGHGNEIDKWVQETTSTEGDPLERFKKRGAEFPDRKFVLESTPSVRGRSNIETGRLASTNHRYYVPCPHCFKFQTIEFGDGTHPGGIFWEKPANGITDIELARKTAHYVCLHCHGKITDIHRPWMMSKGVWIPHGCEPDHEKAMEARQYNPDDLSWMRGTPTRWGSDYGCQISVFYALFHGWGAIAYDKLSKDKQPNKLRQWVNEDKGETWEPRVSKTVPEKVGMRLRTEIPRGVLPAWARLVTVTIDQQAAEGGYRLWVVMAHGPDEMAHIVDYGVTDTLAEIWTQRIERSYEHSDGGNPMRPQAAAADSGWDTKTTYDFCNSKPGMLACKGSSTDMGGRPYNVSGVERGEYEGQMLFTVNTDFWETDLQSRLDDRMPCEAGGLSLCSGAEKDMEFLEHICNATLADRVDNRGNAKIMWVKKNENEPNDFRDAVRYGLALGRAYVEQNGGYPGRSAIRTERTVINRGDSRPDGRGWTE